MFPQPCEHRRFKALIPGACLVVALLFAAACATAPEGIEKDAPIAVWDIENVTAGANGLQPDIGELLSAKIIETIDRSQCCVVVEREKLLLVLEELKLGTTGLVDRSTQLRVGRMLGARLMVFGGYQIIGDFMRLDIRLVDVETGKLVKASERTVAASNPGAWLKAAEAATGELLEH